jgi:hypothetical protein
MSPYDILSLLSSLTMSEIVPTLPSGTFSSGKKCSQQRLEDVIHVPHYHSMFWNRLAPGRLVRFVPHYCVAKHSQNSPANSIGSMSHLERL